MRNILCQIADRMLDLAVPHAAASAGDCYWTAIQCGCRSNTLYYYRCCYGPGTCNCCWCAARYRAPGGCA